MTDIVSYLEVAAFLASLAAWGIIKNSKPLRLFPLLLFVVISVEIYATFFQSANRKFNAWIFNIQVPLQHVLYLLILYNAMEKQRYKKVLLLLGVLFISFTILSWIFFTAKDHFNVLSYCFGAICIIIGIIIKFHEMLRDPVDFNFLKKPFFYILFAYMLFVVGTLPYFVMSNWLYSIRAYKNILLVLINVMNVLNYILYSTYTIAFIWILRRKGYS